jgi:ribosomal protein S12 methylthiotransferase accessory factor
VGERSVGLLDAGAAGAGDALGTALRRRLGARAVDLPVPPVPADLAAVVVSGVPGTDVVAAVRAAGVPLLPVTVADGYAYVGPLTMPGAPGCPECVRLRRDKARTAEQRGAAAQAAERPPLAEPHLTGFAATVAAELVAGELDGEAGAAVPGPAGRTVRALLRIRLDDLAVTRHPFLPEPGCTTCGGLPDDSAGAARITLTAHPKPADSTRLRDLRPSGEELLRTYVDDEVGLIRGLQRSVDGIFPTTGAPMGLVVGEESTETGFGRELTFELARLTAIAEGVERYGGVRPGGRRTACTATLRELGDSAVDPRVFGLHADWQYDLPGFPYQRFTDDVALDWVWAWSFARAEPVLVPETFGYYRTHQHGTTTRPIAYEISNGCALGGCLEEAILHGLLEVVERDAFLMTWYARLPQRKVDLGSAADRRLPLMVERLRHTTGYDVLAFDTTVEHGIASAWVMAVDPLGRADAPLALCAAGAGLDPEKALTAAVLELAPMVEWRLKTYPGERADAAAMVADADRVRSMHDHSLVGAHPDAFDRYGFLLGGDREAVPIAESFAGTARAGRPDLAAELTALTDRFLSRGMDVLVVDQTTAEHRAGGFACVKVLVPGMLPMTFGHRVRRTTGFARLANVPAELGFRSGPLPAAEINADPHPFP